MNDVNCLTKVAALALYDNNGAALARAIGRTRQYVSGLPNGPLPEWMDLKLRFVLHPKRFVPAAMAHLLQEQAP